MSIYENKYLSLGEFLKKKRIEAKITQGELAKDLSISAQMVSNWENGRCGPPSDLLIDLAKFLFIKKEELLQNILMSSEQFYKKKLKINDHKRRKKNTA